MVLTDTGTLVFPHLQTMSVALGKGRREIYKRICLNTFYLTDKSTFPRSLFELSFRRISPTCREPRMSRELAYMQTPRLASAHRIIVLRVIKPFYAISIFESHQR